MFHLEAFSVFLPSYSMSKNQECTKKQPCRMQNLNKAVKNFCPSQAGMH